MNNLVSYSRENGLNDDEILYLANGLANSGDRITFNNGINTCDIPSTGGPSSLSTLICPLFLSVLGNIVLKLGVPGRPAGGIDVLAQISGYNISPNVTELKGWINSSSYVHFLASKYFAPLDSILFNYRKENDAINIPSLVIASLLSKKIAVGLTYMGLDIRVSDFGNFGRTWDEARQNGIRFNKIARLAGIRSQCFLTDGNCPQQTFIGRGEAILALQKIFLGDVDPYLENHLDDCYIMANSISVNKRNGGYSLKSLRNVFLENIRTQGGQPSSFTEIAAKIDGQHKYYIRATDRGILRINMEKMRKAILNIQAKIDGIFPDPCGVILKLMPNANIEKGDILCTFRCLDQKLKEEFENDLTACFETTLIARSFKLLEVIP